MFTRFLISIAFCLLLGGQAVAQSTNVTSPDASRRDGYEGGDRSDSLARDLSERARIARLEGNHKQTIKRAEEGAALALDLQRIFSQRNRIPSEQIKNLEKIEKIARRIRDHSGGSDDGELSVSISSDTSKVLSRLVELSQILRQEVVKTSRQVISVKIITTANEIIVISRQLRHNNP